MFNRGPSLSTSLPKTARLFGFLLWFACGALFAAQPPPASAPVLADPSSGEPTQAVTQPVTLKISQTVDTLFSDVPRNAEDLRAMQTHLQALAEQITPATVAIQLKGGMGSGVIISEDGYVLSAGHVVGRSGQPATFFLSDGRQLQGTTLGANHGVDSGLLKISTDEKFPFAEMGQSANLQHGQWCVALGHPGGYQADRAAPLRLGRILLQGEEIIVSDCTLVGGDSGGPLFDASGKVIGIHSRIGEQIEANLHVPIDTYRRSWDRLARGDVWGGHPPGSSFIGVFEAENSEGAQIGKVVPGGAAEAAGIRRGDIILTFGGKDLARFSDLVATVAACKPGQQIEVTLRRGAEQLSVDLIVGRYGY
jgi:serine protease Do